MKYPITLKPAGTLPRSVELRFTAQREKVGVKKEPAPVVVAPEGLPVGSDIWYDSPNVAVIPFRTYASEVCPDTDISGFTLDDDFDAEEDRYAINEWNRSAWWQLTIPESAGNCQFTLDTQLSGSLPGFSGTDTALYIFTTNEALPLGPTISVRDPPLPLPTAETDFATLFTVDYDDDSGGNGTSRLAGTLAPGIYWICVEPYSGTSDPMIVRLRISLSPVA